MANILMFFVITLLVNLACIQAAASKSAGHSDNMEDSGYGPPPKGSDGEDEFPMKGMDGPDERDMYGPPMTGMGGHDGRGMHGPPMDDMGGPDGRGMHGPPEYGMGGPAGRDMHGPRGRMHRPSPRDGSAYNGFSMGNSQGRGRGYDREMGAFAGERRGAMDQRNKDGSRNREGGGMEMKGYDRMNFRQPRGMRNSEW